MTVLGLREVIELKTLLAQNDAGVLHLHDACAGQHFSLENVNEQTEKLIDDYLSRLGLSPDYTRDKTGFTVTPLPTKHNGGNRSSDNCTL